MSQQSVLDPVKLNGKEPGHTDLSPVGGSPTPPGHDPIEDSQMTLMEHLLELRTRLIWIVGSLTVTTIIAMLFTTQILQFIERPLNGEIPQALHPTEGIMIFFKVSFMVGISLAMPVIVYQLVAFMAPGLYPHEKRTLILTLPAIMLLFITGLSFAYFVMLPVAIAWLQGFMNTVIKQQWTIEYYVDFITRVCFWIGVAFETPVVIAFLARMGLVSGPTLLRFWRHSIVVNTIIAAAITPTVDPVNMAIVTLPLIVLYFVSVGLAYLIYKPRAPRDFSQEPFIKD